MHRSLELEVPPKRVFGVLAAYEAYAEWIPDVSESRILFSEGDICYAEFGLRGQAGAETVTLELIHDRPRAIHFRQVSCPGSPWRGRWALEAWGEGTRLALDYEKAGGGLFSWFGRGRFAIAERIADAIGGHLQSIYDTTGTPILAPDERGSQGVRILLDVVQERDRLVIWLLGRRYELLATEEEGA